MRPSDLREPPVLAQLKQMKLRQTWMDVDAPKKLSIHGTLLVLFSPKLVSYFDHVLTNKTCLELKGGVSH